MFAELLSAQPGQTVTFTEINGPTGAGGTFLGTPLPPNNQGDVSMPPLLANGVAGNFSVVASVPGTNLTAVFDLTNTPGTPARMIEVAGDGQSTSLNTPFGTPLQVQLTDFYGNPVSGKQVTFSITGVQGATGSFGGDTAAVPRTDAQGIATAPTLTATGSTGTFAVGATFDLTPTTTLTLPLPFHLTNTPAVPAAISITGLGNTNYESTPVDRNFANALSVSVTDAGGNLLPAIPVTFTEVDGAGGAGATFNTTDLGGKNPQQVQIPTEVAGAQVGIATVPVGDIKTDGVAGNFTVIASVGGLSTTFFLNYTAGAVRTITAITGGNQSATVLGTYGNPLVVLAADAFGNPVAGETVTFTVPQATVTQGNRKVNTFDVQTNSAGLAISPTLTATNVAGTYTATATDGTLSAKFQLTNGADVPNLIAPISGDNQPPVVVGSSSLPLIVEVEDANLNGVPNIPVTFQIVSGGAHATFSDGSGQIFTKNSGPDGTVTSPTLTAQTTGTVQVRVSVPSRFNVLPVTFTLTNVATAATLAPDDSTGPSGNNQSVNLGGLGRALKVIETSATGQPLPTDNITFSIEGHGLDDTGPSAVFQTHDALGNLTFSDTKISVPLTLSPDGTTGTANTSAYELRANTHDGVVRIDVFQEGANGPTTQFTMNILANSDSTTWVLKVVAGSNQAATVGTPFPSQLVVQLTDSNGNPVRTGNVTFTARPDNFSATAAVPTGTFGGPQTNNLAASPNVAHAPINSDGFASVSGLYAGNTAGNFIVVAQVDGTGANAVNAVFALTNDPGSPANVAATGGDQQSTRVNTAFANPLTAQATDSLGNPLSGVPVTFAVSGVDQPITSASCSQNVATFTTQFAHQLHVGDHVTIAGIPVNATDTPYDGDFIVQTVPDAVTFTVTLSGVGNDPGPVTGTPANPFVGHAVVSVDSVSSAENFGAQAQSVVIFTNAQGYATVPAVTAVTTSDPGASFVVTASTDGVTQPARFYLTNVGPTTLIRLNGDNQATPIGTAFGQSLQAQVLDENGVPMANVPVTFAVSQVDEPLIAASWTAAAPGQATGTATFSTQYGQGLRVGDTVTVSNVSSTGVGTYNGSWLVTRVDNGNQFEATPTNGGDAVADRGTPTGFGDALVPIPTVSSATADVPVIAASWSPAGGGVATITTKYNPNVVVGDTVTINNIAPTGYDGTFVVASVNGNKFTVKGMPSPTGRLVANIATVFGDVQVPILSGSTEIFAASPTVLTNAQGIATAPTLSANLVVSPPGSSFFGTATIDGAPDVAAVSYTLINTGVPYQVAQATDNAPASLTSQANAFHFVLPVVVNDFYGRPIPNATLTFNVVALNSLSAPRANTPAGSFDGSSSITVHTDQNGEALVTTLARNAVVGKFGVDVYAVGDPIPYTFTLTNASVPPKTVAVDPPSSIATVDATYLQSSNAAFQQHFAALVTDASGNPKSGVAVTFSVPNNPLKAGANFQGQGVVTLNGQSQITVTTGANGVATVPTANSPIANDIAGSFTMTLSTTLVGYHPNTILLKNTPGVPDPGHIKATVVPFVTPFMTVYNLQVTVADKNGNTIPNVAVGLTISSVPDGVFFLNSLDITSAATTNNKGIATVPLGVLAANKKSTFTLNLMVEVAVPGGSIVVPITVPNVIFK